MVAQLVALLLVGSRDEGVLMHMCVHKGYYVMVQPLVLGQHITHVLTITTRDKIYRFNKSLSNTLQGHLKATFSLQSVK